MRHHVPGLRGREGRPRIGLFGLLGSGNLGNDASFEVVLRFLHAEHPEVIVDAMCLAPERLSAEYGIDAVSLLWYHRYLDGASGELAAGLKVLGKGVEVFRTMWWVRRHDAVIVPGAGALEATLPVRWWGMPWALFLLSASGRVFGTKVAFVSVGANVMNQQVIRWLSNAAARLAYYRSYRDEYSRDALRQRGLDTSRDEVYPDLVFGLPAPDEVSVCVGTVGVGVMDYGGANDDRAEADEIRASYLAKLTAFVEWLVDNGRTVHFLTGDTGFDLKRVHEILADLRARRPDLPTTALVAPSFSSPGDLSRAIAQVETVVATRYHNVVTALRLSKPTITIGYSTKHDVLMADMGMERFCQPLRSLDVERLIGQYRELESRAPELTQMLKHRNAARARDLDRQFGVLSRVLLTGSRSGHNRIEVVPPESRTRPDTATRSGTPVKGDVTTAYKKDFWSKERPKFEQPHYRLLRCAQLVNTIAAGRHRSLLDVGCGPATLRRCLDQNIDYHGVDLVIPHRASYLAEADVLNTPIAFGDKRFDIVVAQGLFEYLGDAELDKFREIASLLNTGGKFLVTYTNFGHRRPRYYEAFSNIRSIDSFRDELAVFFEIERCFPASHNWSHGQPVRPVATALNRHLNANIPLVSKSLAVEYFFVCTPRTRQAPR